MSSQSKANIFGCASTHRISNRQHTELTAEQFLALDETREYIANHPGSYDETEGGIFICEELTLRYLHLTGNKRAKKALRKALAGKE